MAAAVVVVVAVVILNSPIPPTVPRKASTVLPRASMVPLKVNITARLRASLPCSTNKHPLLSSRAGGRAAAIA